MNTVSFIQATRELISQIKNSDGSLDQRNELQEMISFLSLEMSNPTLACLLELVEVGNENNLDVSSIKTKLVEINYFD